MYILDMYNRKMKLPAAGEALPGRAEPIATAVVHAVSGAPLSGPFPAKTETAIFALGSFWTAERLFWPLPGVVVTAAGFAGGSTPNPTYQEVCTGQTGHAEAVRVVFDPARIAFAELVALFFESNDPTQGMRQGSAMGTQYRSLLFVPNEAQRVVAGAAKAAYQAALAAAGHGGTITTEILDRGEFFYAEAEHQQYLARNPQAHRAAGGTGVRFPIGGETAS
jgi:peptide-methionine (S)-S-oxide reductase